MNNRRRVVDFHFFGEDADLQREIDARGLIHVQADIGQHGSAKAVLLHGHPVVPRRQQGDGEIAVVIGRRAAGGIGRYAGYGHPRFGYDTAAGIGHRAGDGAGRIVCQEWKDQRTPQQRHA